MLSFNCLLLSDWLQCAYLEATNCQVESKYLGFLRKVQETKSLDPAQRVAVQKMIEDALKGELKSVIKLNTVRYGPGTPDLSRGTSFRTIIVPSHESPLVMGSDD